jgi:hypothetical protein
MRPFLLIGLFCAAISAACHKSNPILNHSRPLVYGPGSWRWVEEDWSFLQNSGVITPSPDSLTLLQINPDLSYAVGGSIPGHGGTYRNDTIMLLNPGHPLVDSFYLFDRNVTLSTGAIMPQKMHHRLSHDTLYLTTDITPAGFSTFVFVPAQ